MKRSQRNRIELVTITCAKKEEEQAAMTDSVTLKFAKVTTNFVSLALTLRGRSEKEKTRAVAACPVCCLLL